MRKIAKIRTIVVLIIISSLFIGQTKLSTIAYEENYIEQTEVSVISETDESVNYTQFDDVESTEVCSTEDISETMMDEDDENVTTIENSEDSFEDDCEGDILLDDCTTQESEEELTSNCEELQLTSFVTTSAAPDFSVPSGLIHSGVGIMLASSNGPSSIYYTFDGSTPTKNSLKYTTEMDRNGYIYLPANISEVTIKAISFIYNGQTTVTSRTYTIVPSIIHVEDSSYNYEGELSNGGFLTDYSGIRGITKGNNMPYQQFTSTLKPGDSIAVTLNASGFNGELYIFANSRLQMQDVRPINASMVASKYDRTVKYLNTTSSVQNIVIIVTSGELLEGQRLASGRGSYTLKTNIKRSISKIDVTLSNAVVVKGRNIKATATITPYDAADKKIVWKLTDLRGNEVNPSFIRIDNAGKISVLKDAETPTAYKVIAMSETDKYMYGEQQFKVYPSVTRMEVIDDSVKISVNGAIRTYDATKNFAVTPSNSFGEYVYSSSNNSVATVSDKGIVSAIAPGKARIYITLADGSQKKIGFWVNVTAFVNNIVLKPSTSVDIVNTFYPICTGGSIYINSIITPNDATDKSLTYSFVGAVPASVTLRNNKLTVDKFAVPGQEFTVKAIANDGSGKSNTIRFKTYSKPSKIVFNTNKVELNTINNKTMVLKATVEDANGRTDGVLQNIKWTSSNEDVVSVSSSGVLIAKKKGNAVIKASTCDGTNVRGSVSVNVISGVTSIEISTKGSPQGGANPQPIAAGRRTELTAICYPIDANNKRVTWELRNAPEGVTLKNGVIDIPAKVKSGSIMVTAKANDGFGASKTRTFNIYQDWVKKVVISASSSSLNTVTNKNCYLKAAVSPSQATFPGVVWSSSNEKVATVSSTGAVTAIGPGSTTITATAKDGYGANSNIKISVTQPMTSFNIENRTGLITNDNKLLLVSGANDLIIKNVLPEKVSDRKIRWSIVEKYDGVTINPSSGKVTVSNDMANRISKLTIRATIVSSGNYIERTAAVFPKTTKVCLSPTDAKFTMTVGAVREIKPSVMPLHAYNSYTANQFSYISSKPTVATVSPKGVVTATGKGSAIITIKATDGSNRSARATVTVK